MKSTPTLCEVLILFICMCILLFCFKSFFLSVLLSCFPAVPALFVRQFPLARGPLCAVLLFPGNSGSKFFSSCVDFHRRCTTVLKNRFVPGHFSTSAPPIQFQTRKVHFNLYFRTIRFKYAYCRARALLAFIMHCFIIIMKFDPCNQL